jgi:hypothetical protein
VARQLGHSVAVLLSTYAQLLVDFAGRERIDAESEIEQARRDARSRPVPASAGG